MLPRFVLPDGPTALGHPANEDLFAGTPVRAATSWRVYLFLLGLIFVALPLVLDDLLYAWSFRVS
jgi:hypothetical protein